MARKSVLAACVLALALVMGGLYGCGNNDTYVAAGTTTTTAAGTTTTTAAGTTTTTAAGTTTTTAAGTTTTTAAGATTTTTTASTTTTTAGAGTTVTLSSTNTTAAATSGADTFRLETPAASCFSATITGGFDYLTDKIAYPVAANKPSAVAGGVNNSIDGNVDLTWSIPSLSCTVTIRVSGLAIINEQALESNAVPAIYTTY